MGKSKNDESEEKKIEVVPQTITTQQFNGCFLDWIPLLLLLWSSLKVMKLTS